MLHVLLVVLATPRGHPAQSFSYEKLSDSKCKCLINQDIEIAFYGFYLNFNNVKESVLHPSFKNCAEGSWTIH